MTQPIRIHAQDATIEQVRARHAEIEKRLEELGVDRVRMMLFHGGFPTEWNNVIHAWLAGDKLQPEADKLNPENAKPGQAES
jgi:hypothetical protein